MNPGGTEIGDGSVAKFSVSYNGGSYVTGQSNETQASIILPWGATIKIKDIAMQQTYYLLNNVTWAGSALTASSGIYTATVTTAAQSLNINTKYNSYYLDLNGWLDGASNGGISGFGTADVYINGSQVANDVADYWVQWPYGTTYEIKDIKATSGHIYNGVYSGSLSGTIGAGNVSVRLNFTSKPIQIYYHPNGGTVGGSYKTYNNWVSSNGTSYFYHSVNIGGSTDPYNYTTFGITRTGYNVPDGTEWNTNASGTGTSFDHDVVHTYNQYKEVSTEKSTYYELDLYTKWAINTYTIKFNGNGSTGGSMSNLSMTYGTAKNLTSNAFTRAGYTFAGWNTAANGSGTSYSNGQGVNNLTSTNGGTVNLYAQWTETKKRIFIRTMFQYVIGRTPNDGEYTTYLSFDGSQIVWNVVASSEAATYHNSLVAGGNPNFMVTQLYIAMLGRSPSSAELQAMRNVHGTSYANMAKDINNNLAEFKTRCNNDGLGWRAL